MPLCKLIIKDEVNIKLEGLPVDIRRKLVNKFKYIDPTARYRPAYQLGRWDGSVTLFGMGGNGYINQLPTILSVLEDSNYEIEEIQDLRTPLKLNFTKVTNTYWADQGKVWGSGHRFEGESIMLRDDQVEVVNRFIENPQSLQEVATGAGKTIMTATLAQLCEPYGRTMIIVPNKSLVEQTEEDFQLVGLDVGVYYGDRKELNKTHTICTWQSLNILDKKSKNNEHEIVTLAEFLDGVQCVMIDEVHMAKATVLKNLLTQNFCNAAIRWGLTGTVPKEDYESEIIFASIGPVVGGITAHELQELGVLSNLHVNVLQLFDLPEFKSYTEELKYLVTNKEVKTKDRKEEYKEHATSDKKITVATYGVAAVGINIPRIFNLVLLEPGKSFVRVIQSIGRGIRKAEDKDFVQIWDITSTCKYAKKHLTERKKFYKEAKYPFTLEKIEWN